MQLIASSSTSSSTSSATSVSAMALLLAGAAAVADAHSSLDFSTWDDLPDMPQATSDMTVTEVGGLAYLVGGCTADQLFVCVRTTVLRL